MSVLYTDAILWGVGDSEVVVGEVDDDSVRRAAGGS